MMAIEGRGKGKQVPARPPRHLDRAVRLELRLAPRELPPREEEPRHPDHSKDARDDDGRDDELLPEPLGLVVRRRRLARRRADDQAHDRRDEAERDVAGDHVEAHRGRRARRHALHRNGHALAFGRVVED